MPPGSIAQAVPETMPLLVKENANVGNGLQEQLEKARLEQEEIKRKIKEEEQRKQLAAL